MEVRHVSSPDVLVVGAGPTGIVLASELTRHGVTCRIVDQARGRSLHSKALAIQPRTLEALDAMGLADDLVAQGSPIHGFNAYASGEGARRSNGRGARLVHVEFDDAETAFPYILSLPQSDTERILEERLARLGLAVERGVRLGNVIAGEEGVTSTLVRDDGVQEMVHTPWLVGCDGAHSAVRKALGIGFEGAKYDEGFTLADVALSWDRPHDETHVFFSPEGVIAALPLPGEGRWRLVAELDDPAPTLATFRALMAGRGDPSAKIEDPTWIAPFRIHRRLAPAFRRGRCFLAGDAAHIHSPLGGQGMNTGIQDAVNLAWKLALVVRGEGQPSLLTSYETERRPVAAATLQGTDLAMRVVTLRSPITREIRDRLAATLSSFDVVQRRITRAAFELTVHYRRSPIVAEDRASPITWANACERLGDRASLRDWFDFSAGPAPGERVPDAPLDDLPLHRALHHAVGHSQAPPRLASLLRGTSHLLLLFEGGASADSARASEVRERGRPIPDEGDRFEPIFAGIRASHALRVRPIVVLTRDTSSRLPRLESMGIPVILDRDASIHRRFGAASECLYVVRPDGYVAYRSQPADAEKLEAYLSTIFV